MRRLLMVLPVPLLALVITVQAGGSGGAGVDGKDPSIWDGVYTQAQLERATVPLRDVCRRCHSDDLGGSERGPSLHGARFMTNWETQDLSALFAKVKDTMPPDSPSSLPDEDYIAMVALILKTNGYPVGSETLTLSKLDGIKIIGKPGETPKDIGNFRLVEVVGCLAHGDNDAWTLTHTSPPSLTNDKPSTERALSSAARQPLGTATYRLVSANGFDPAAHVGQKMQAKGLLYRAPGKDRLNLVALEPVGQNCTP
jgi:hypothetical protein